MPGSRSPEVGATTERILRSTTRNPRRRQRQSDDTLKTSAPRRKRSKISEDTFKPLESIENAEDDGFKDTSENPASMNGHAYPPVSAKETGGRAPAAPGDHQTAVRTERKQPLKRAHRGDGAVVLAQTPCYTVKLLPGTPRELRRTGLEYRGSLGPSNYALAVTKTQAIIWDYSTHSSGGIPRFVDLPFPCDETGPLPFGALVSNGAGTSNIGLLLISATTGSAAFYESIEQAASIGLFQDQRQVTDGSVGPLFSGEVIVDLISADHAGFIVVYSSGRIAHLTLWDGRGKAKLHSNYLRATDPTARGLLGSLKEIWKGDLYMRDQAAVHVWSRERLAHVQVLSLAKKCQIAIWDLDWSGRSTFRGKLDFLEAILTDLKGAGVIEPGNRGDTVSAADFVILENNSNGFDLAAETNGEEQQLGLLVLLQIGMPGSFKHVLAEISLSGDNVTISRVTQMAGYHASSQTSQHSPRLLLPSPGHTAYVVFQEAIGLFSMEQTAMDGPEAQLHPSEVFPSQFEDAIYLRSGMDLAIQNAAPEEQRGSQASLIAFVKSAGLVRLSACSVDTARAAKISIKCRIEQAVFLGVLQDGILDFAHKEDWSYDTEEVESAALAISDEVVRSASPFMLPSPSSIAQQLANKARALKALVEFVSRNFAPLSRSTMWRLLWDAERIAAGQDLWIAFSEHVETTSTDKRKATLMDELCAWFDTDENEHFPHRQDLSDEDPVRRFFIGGLHRFEKLLLNTRIFLRDHQDQLRNQGAMNPEDILQLVAQANDIWICSLEAAFGFRSTNAADYGIPPNFIVRGVLAGDVDYHNLPEFWTSTEALVNASIIIAKLSREFATNAFEEDQAMPAVELLVRKISNDNPRLITLYCLMCDECILWHAARTSEKDKEAARRLKVHFRKTRYEQFRGLAEVGQAAQGMKLAEKYRDMNTLTHMVVAEDQYLEESYQDATLTDAEKQFIGDNREQLELKMRALFEQYGEQWAGPFFDMAFSSNAAGANLIRAQSHWKSALATYLRALPTRAKLCWINDITEMHDFGHAGAVLAYAAKEQERRLWAKKVELSMSKLALLAAEEAGLGDNKATSAINSFIDSPAKELAIADIQDKLYDHIQPEIRGCIDREAELEACMKSFGTRVDNLSSLRQLLEAGFNMLLDHAALSVEQLIDVLTLMDNLNDADDEDNLQGSEFYFALVALDTCSRSLPAARFDMLQRLIWKRCYIYDNWADIKLASKQSDDERRTILRQTATWHTFYHTQEHNFFDQPNCSTRPLTPSECLGTACSPEELSYRFQSEELLDPIVHDLKIQDEMLASYVTDRKLDDVAKECQRDAKATLEEGAMERARMSTEDKYLDEDGIEGLALRASTAMANGHLEDVPRIFCD